MNQQVQRNEESWRHGFRIFSHSEQSDALHGYAVTDFGDLCERTKLLAVLLNIVPRICISDLDIVLDDFLHTFPASSSADAPALRKRAREVLKQARSLQIGLYTPEEELRELEQLFGLATGTDTGQTEPGCSVPARQMSAFCLAVWKNQLVSRPEWRTLPNVVPGGQPLPFEEVYVELFARQSEREFGCANVSLQSRDSFLDSTIDLSTMVARSFRGCVVVGEPGSGKSTLIKWIVWASAQRLLADFDFALPIRLRDFAAVRVDDPKISLLEFFLDSLGTKFSDFYDVANCIRVTAERNGRFLLLLDGWDEVPLSQRDTVRRAIHREWPHFVTVVTSRIAGNPLQLISDGPVDVYEVAGLSRQSIRDFVARQTAGMGERERADTIVHAIETNNNLANLATNPFLLGLLVRLLLRDECDEGFRARSQLYDQLCGWIRDQHEHHRGKAAPLVQEHLQGLERLSSQLVFLDRSPRFTFRQEELDCWLPNVAISPLIESRFIHKLDSEFDFWAFLHATFEEYFAAKQLFSTTDEEARTRWDKALCSQTRQVTLSFYCGLDADRSQALAKRWLEQLDRFGFLLIRLFQLACQGGWIHSKSPLAHQIEEQVWLSILSQSDWRLGRHFLDVFARNASTRLLERASRENRLDSRILEAICDILPGEQVRQSRLFDRLPDLLQDAVSVKGHDESHVDDVEIVLTALSDESLSTPEQLGVARVASTIPDPRVAATLLDRIGTEENEMLRANLVLALAPIFGQLPTDRLVQVVTRADPWEDTIRRMAGASLGHSHGDSRKLGPVERDRLLRQLALIGPTDERVYFLLMALRGYPVREGGRVISAIAIDQILDVDVRMIAIDVLETVTDDEVVQNAAKSVVQETNPLVVDRLIRLAARRQIELPHDWLEAQIEAATDSFVFRTLWTIYLSQLPRLKRSQAERSLQFLKKWIERILTEKEETDDLQAFGLASALELALKQNSDWCSREIRKPAIERLRTFVKHRRPPDARIRLSATLLSTSGQLAEQDLLYQTLQVLITQASRVSDKHERLVIEALATQTAEFLANLLPTVLLQFPVHCEPVREVLMRRSLEQGWLVFSERIFDADGDVLTDVNETEVTDLAEDEFAEGGELISWLPESERNAVLCRYAVTVMFKLCDPDSPDKEFYLRMHEMMSGDHGMHAKELIGDLYLDEFPSIETWRRNVNRAVKKLRGRPNCLNLLRDIGKLSKK